MARHSPPTMSNPRSRPKWKNARRTRTRTRRRSSRSRTNPSPPQPNPSPTIFPIIPSCPRKPRSVLPSAAARHNSTPFFWPGACPPDTYPPRSLINSPPFPRMPSRRICVTWKPTAMHATATINNCSYSRIRTWYGADTLVPLPLSRALMEMSSSQYLLHPPPLLLLLPNRPSQCPSKSIPKRRNVCPFFGRRFINRNLSARNWRRSTYRYVLTTFMKVNW
mmetsp:Transcript_38923/g.70129  ORF Transcript_38923/g.70129 Transcript_38923/m.70129 type:complete len:221 (-) Transcript_38923:1643-2305(-)